LHKRSRQNKKCACFCFCDCCVQQRKRFWWGDGTLYGNSSNKEVVGEQGFAFVCVCLSVRVCVCVWERQRCVCVDWGVLVVKEICYLSLETSSTNEQASSNLISTPQNEDFCFFSQQEIQKIHITPTLITYPERVSNRLQLLFLSL
jgi:hypothetical protein